MTSTRPCAPPPTPIPARTGSAPRPASREILPGCGMSPPNRCCAPSGTASHRPTDAALAAGVVGHPAGCWACCPSTPPATTPPRPTRSAAQSWTGSCPPTPRPSARFATRAGTPQPPPADRPDQTLIVAMPTTPGLPGQGPLPTSPPRRPCSRPVCPTPSCSANPATAATPTGPQTSRRPGPTSWRTCPSCAIAHFACHGSQRVRRPLQEPAPAPRPPQRAAERRQPRRHLPRQRPAGLPVGLQHRRHPHHPPARRVHPPRLGLPARRIPACHRHPLGDQRRDRPSTSPTSSTRTLMTSAGTLDTGHSAYALHHAVRTVRDTCAGTPSLWAAHLHAGA